MATTIPRPAGSEPASFTPSRTPNRPRERRPRQNFETWSWFFMRVSGLVLVFLSLLHFAITHIINDVIETDAAFVAARWENPLWRLFDLSLLYLAMVHGLNGVRWSIDDYIRSQRARAAVKAVLYTVSGALLVYGTITIVTFGT
jgi:succinate dehydrogenase / fumarate reductase membrane anchor subunit